MVPYPPDKVIRPLNNWGLVQRQLEGQSGTYDILRNGKMSHSMTSHSPDLIPVMVTYVAPKADRPCGLWPGGVRPTTAVHHGGNSNIASFRSRRGRVHNSWRRGEDSKQSDTVYLFGAYAVELRRATPFFPQ